MFYCNECADKRMWPRSWHRSHGECEICEKMADCNDISSKDLPIPKENRVDQRGLLRCRCHINVKYYAKQAKVGGNMKGYKPCPIHEMDKEER